MKPTTLAFIATVTFMAALAIPVRLTAQEACSKQGHPCEDSGGGRCCPGLVCEFRGGTSRIGYFCEAVPGPTINALPAPSAGAVNLAYGFTFTATGGSTPLTWSETGDLPPGLSFADGGQLAGVPTKTGSFPITVGVHDTDDRSTAQDFTIQVFTYGFKTIASMTVARSSQTATLLSGGKVLVTGGYGAAGPLASAELFDSASGTFAATGSMATARSGQTATLLTGGRVVLVAGGGSATTELFDVATGKFSLTGQMEASRSTQTATLLKMVRCLWQAGPMQMEML